MRTPHSSGNAASGAPMGRLRYHCLSGLLLLLALAAKAEEATATVPCDKDDKKNKEDKFSHFEEIFLTVIFIILVWISGKIAAAAGAPSLVGEILVGVILGPHVVDFVPFPSALKSIGEVGLCLHALEAGLMVDVEMLEIFAHELANHFGRLTFKLLQEKAKVIFFCN